MTTYNTFDVILEGYQVESHEDAVDWARGFVFGECESSEQNIGYSQYIDTVNGIDVYYDYGADYYFFTDETEE